MDRTDIFLDINKIEHGLDGGSLFINQIPYNESNIYLICVLILKVKVMLFIKLIRYIHTMFSQPYRGKVNNVSVPLTFRLAGERSTPT